MAIRGNLKHANNGDNHHLKTDLKLLSNFRMRCSWLHCLTSEKQTSYNTIFTEKNSHLKSSLKPRPQIFISSNARGSLSILKWWKQRAWGSKEHKTTAMMNKVIKVCKQQLCFSKNVYQNVSCYHDGKNHKNKQRQKLPYSKKSLQKCHLLPRSRMGKII